MDPLETFLAVLVATVAIVLWISVRYWGTKVPPRLEDDANPRASGVSGSSRGSTRSP